MINLTSQKLLNIETNLIKLMQVIFNNQNLLRYIYYGDDAPLDKGKRNVTYLDIKDKQVFLTPYNPQVVPADPAKAKVVVFINPFKSNFTDDAIAVDFYLIDIVVPFSQWVIHSEDALRPIRIAAEICKVVDNQRIAGIGLVKVTDYKTYVLNDLYGGLGLFVSVNNSAVKV